MKPDVLLPSDTFVHRHVGPSSGEIGEMLSTIGALSLEALIEETVPASIRRGEPLAIDGIRGERASLARMAELAEQNELYRSYIGMGYYPTITPPVILRNILENPGWYTQYTPYQPEISQGRLEALINFQTMVCDLTGMTLSNSSLLDEATAAAEAMTMCRRIARDDRKIFYVAGGCHPQTLAVVKTRATPLGIDVVVGPAEDVDFENARPFGILLSYPATDGRVEDYQPLIAKAHQHGVLVAVATDLLSLTLLRSPGELGADIAIGSSQRFGVPMGYGGPHAAFLATREEYSRHVPGRIIGVSRDAAGKPAYRLALQTREQHIRRDRATSNICTAQVLLAVMAGMYGVYHGPAGLKQIAERVHGLTSVLAAGLQKGGIDIGDHPFFDTLRVRLEPAQAQAILAAAEQARINLRRYEGGDLGVSLDETTTLDEVGKLLEVFLSRAPSLDALVGETSPSFPASLARTSGYLTHPVFHLYRSEHQLLRYIHKLQSRDLSLTTSMIALGSCTMKLNATSEMLPVTWPKLGELHPFCPPSQAKGYARLHRDLEGWLNEITGFAGTSLQPNAGAQGEYAGLLVIRAFHEERGEGHRDVCLIPTSAHGTNPASAVLAGYRVVAVSCDEVGNIDVADLEKKAKEHAKNLAATMITYPSTHGVFEEKIRDICKIIHDAGGQVYLDGANMNAQVGVCRPGDFGADVCHLNLHKTFCIPHGGGGPGMGPICVAPHLVPFLPGHPMMEHGDKSLGPVSAAPYGSPSILPISWMYIAMMGGEGLTRATQVAILNANYMAKRLEGAYPVLYRGARGRVAHEFILDLRPFKKSAGVEAEDVAKRLMDFGFHAPTMSFPVAGTLMIEPTESESKDELDRFCEAMLIIREEIRAIEDGRMDRAQNPLKRAPHTAHEVSSNAWDRPYSREQAAYPAPWLREYKFWPPVERIDNAYGDRNLMCSCPPMESYSA